MTNDKLTFPIGRGKVPVNWLNDRSKSDIESSNGRKDGILPE